ncbi:hypothetical protein [Algivirga pacifica]|uniref:Helix-turn-helix domain-containing protein n=1 Tax=Algivirga pacifica TaxID=1162670 RepID=A0ABP9D4R2_9BACT
MGKQIELKLSKSEIKDLQHLLFHSEKPYLRERASAVLKVNEGLSCTYIASKGLLRHRRTHTVLEWIHAYQALGIDGLYMKEGRGRKPSFFPSK